MALRICTRYCEWDFVMSCSALSGLIFRLISIARGYERSWALYVTLKPWLLGIQTRTHFIYTQTHIFVSPSLRNPSYSLPLLYGSLFLYTFGRRSDDHHSLRPRGKCLFSYSSLNGLFSASFSEEGEQHSSQGQCLDADVIKKKLSFFVISEKQLI